MNRRKFLPLMLMPTAAWAHSYKLGEIAIGHGWALPSQQNDGQVFMPLVNNGDTEDALIAARSEICAVIELRTNNRYDEPAAEKFTLPPSRPVPMRPPPTSGDR
jgi:copper(I)-binding protein